MAAQKMRETGKKMRKRWKIPAQNFITTKKSPPVQDLFGAYKVLNYKQKYKNILNTHLYMKGKIQKVGQPEVKRGQKSQMLESIFAWCKNFAPCAIFFVGFIFLASYAVLSFLFMICNAEFDSNSSCLDRLNKIDINSLQKLQN